MITTLACLNWLKWFEQRHGFRPKHLRVERSVLEQLAREARMPVDFMPLWFLEFDGIPIEARRGA